MIYIEVIQSLSISLTEYFSDSSNAYDVYTYCTSLLLVIVQLLEIDVPPLRFQRLIAAFAVLMTWLKVLDWLRLFEKTSFYIKLITETIYDIGYFMIIFVAALCMFGNTMFMF